MADKSQPVVGSSLPPDVRGNVTGEVCIVAEQIIWSSPSDTPSSPSHVPISSSTSASIHVRWWGDSGPTVALKPPFDEEAKSAVGDVVAYFPIRSKAKSFRQYLQDMGALQLEVFDAQNSSLLLGKTYLTLSSLSDKAPIQGFFSVHSEDGHKLGRLKVFLGLKFYDMNDPSQARFFSPDFGRPSSSSSSSSRGKPQPQPEVPSFQPHRPIFSNSNVSFLANESSAANTTVPSSSHHPIIPPPASEDQQHPLSPATAPPHSDAIDKFTPRNTHSRNFLQPKRLAPAALPSFNSPTSASSASRPQRGQKKQHQQQAPSSDEAQYKPKQDHEDEPEHKDNRNGLLAMDEDELLSQLLNRGLELRAAMRKSLLYGGSATTVARKNGSQSHAPQPQPQPQAHHVIPSSSNYNGYEPGVEDLNETFSESDSSSSSSSEDEKEKKTKEEHDSGDEQLEDAPSAPLGGPGGLLEEFHKAVSKANQTKQKKLKKGQVSIASDFSNISSISLKRVVCALPQDVKPVAPLSSSTLEVIVTPPPSKSSLHQPKQLVQTTNAPMDIAKNVAGFDFESENVLVPITSKTANKSLILGRTLDFIVRGVALNAGGAANRLMTGGKKTSIATIGIVSVPYSSLVSMQLEKMEEDSVMKAKLSLDLHAPPPPPPKALPSSQQKKQAAAAAAAAPPIPPPPVVIGKMEILFHVKLADPPSSEPPQSLTAVKTPLQRETPLPLPLPPSSPLQPATKPSTILKPAQPTKNRTPIPIQQQQQQPKAAAAAAATAAPPQLEEQKKQVSAEKLYLQVSVYDATDLISSHLSPAESMAADRHRNAFVAAKIGAGLLRSKTEVAWNTDNPKWQFQKLIDLDGSEASIQSLCASSAVFEAWDYVDNQRDELIGLVRIPLSCLKSFFKDQLGVLFKDEEQEQDAALTDDERVEVKASKRRAKETVKSLNMKFGLSFPLVAANGYFPIRNPITGIAGGKLRLSLAVGTRSQLQRFKECDEAAAKIQSVAKRKLSLGLGPASAKKNLTAHITAPTPSIFVVTVEALSLSNAGALLPSSSSSSISLSSLPQMEIAAATAKYRLLSEEDSVLSVPLSSSSSAVGASSLSHHVIDASGVDLLKDVVTKKRQSPQELLLQWIETHKLPSTRRGLQFELSLLPDGSAEFISVGKAMLPTEEIAHLLRRVIVTGKELSASKVFHLSVSAAHAAPDEIPRFSVRVTCINKSSSSSLPVAEGDTKPLPLPVAPISSLHHVESEAFLPVPQRKPLSKNSNINLLKKEEKKSQQPKLSSSSVSSSHPQQQQQHMFQFPPPFGFIHDKLPDRTAIRFDLMQCIGLEAAALEASRSDLRMRFACQAGVNTFVRFGVHSKKAAGPLEQLIRGETPIIARDFCPSFGFSKTFIDPRISLRNDENLYKAILRGDLELHVQVYHRLPAAAGDKVSSSASEHLKAAPLDTIEDPVARRLDLVSARLFPDRASLSFADLEREIQRAEAEEAAAAAAAGSRPPLHDQIRRTQKPDNQFLVQGKGAIVQQKPQQTGKDVLLGVATIPLVSLLTSSRGLNGWFQLFSPMETKPVGAVELQMMLDASTQRALFQQQQQQQQQQQDQKQPMIHTFRITVSVEDLTVPTEHLQLLHRKLNPLSGAWDAVGSVPPKKGNVVASTVQYYTTYSVYGEIEPSTSPLFDATSTATTVPVQYTREFKRIVGPEILRFLREEKLSVQVLCSLPSSSSSSGPIPVGTAFVDMLSLIHPLAAEQDSVSPPHSGLPKRRIISGIYPLINPSFKNLSNGRIKLKIMLETMPMLSSAPHHPPSATSRLALPSSVSQPLHAAVEEEEDYEHMSPHTLDEELMSKQSIQEQEFQSAPPSSKTSSSVSASALDSLDPARAVDRLPCSDTMRSHMHRFDQEISQESDESLHDRLQQQVKGLDELQRFFQSRLDNKEDNINNAKPIEPSPPLAIEQLQSRASASLLSSSVPRELPVVNDNEPLFLPSGRQLGAGSASLLDDSSYIEVPAAPTQPSRLLDFDKYLKDLDSLTANLKMKLAAPVAEPPAAPASLSSTVLLNDISNISAVSAMSHRNENQSAVARRKYLDQYLRDMEGSNGRGSQARRRNEREEISVEDSDEMRGVSLASLASSLAISDFTPIRPDLYSGSEREDHDDDEDVSVSQRRDNGGGGDPDLDDFISQVYERSRITSSASPSKHEEEEEDQEQHDDMSLQDDNIRRLRAEIFGNLDSTPNDDDPLASPASFSSLMGKQKGSSAHLPPRSSPSSYNGAAKNLPRHPAASSSSRKSPSSLSELSDSDDDISNLLRDSEFKKLYQRMAGN